MKKVVPWFLFLVSAAFQGVACNTEFEWEKLATGGAPSGGNLGSGGSLSSGGAVSAGGTIADAGALSNGGSAGATTDAGAAAGGTSAEGGAPTGGTLNTAGASAGEAGEVGETAGAGGQVNRPPVFHVFLLLGQSNMAGYPKASAADRVEDARVQVLGFDACSSTGRQLDKWDTAAPPLHACWSDAIGPGDYFAKTLIETLPSGDTIGLVPCAIHGERIETFLKVGGTRYDWILQRAKLAQEAGGVIDGILFHQGESNSQDSSWPGKVNTLITDLRTDLEIGDVPFLAGELARDGNSRGHNPLINQLPDVVSNAFVVSAEDLIVDPADTQYLVHFDHDSIVTFGQRYAQTLIEAKGW